jgi:glycosyltransferase involved in cell wall biosynthesis
MGRAILHLIDSLDPAAGGPGEFVRAVSREHAAMGHRACVALLTRPDGPAPDGLEIVMAGTKAEFGGYGFQRGLAPWLRKEAPRYDAVFVHGLWQYHGAAAWRALGSRDTPYYLFPHGMLDPWCVGNGSLRLKKRLYWELIEKHVARNARALLFTSKAESEASRRSLGAAWREEELVELGVAEPPTDIKGQREAFLSRFPELRGRRIVLFLGRLDRKKGCELLARAFASMATEDCDLVLAGPCPDAAYRAELEKVGGRIHFTGMLVGAAKWGAFRCAEVFALPSHQENFGIAVAEALACGVPVLLSTAVNIHETVTDNGAGFADTDDMDGTRRLLQRWMGLGAGERERMKLAAEQCFRGHFHIRQTAARMLSLLETK